MTQAGVRERPHPPAGGESRVGIEPERQPGPEPGQSPSRSPIGSPTVSPAVTFLPHLARQVGHDAVAWRPGRWINKHLSQRPTVTSSRPVVPEPTDPRGPRAKSIDSVTLSDRQSQGEHAPSRRYARLRHRWLAAQNRMFGVLTWAPKQAARVHALWRCAHPSRLNSIAR